MLGAWLLIPGHMGLYNGEYVTHEREEDCCLTTL